jgi:hypothetical protein
MAMSFVVNQLLLRISGSKMTNELNDRSLTGSDVSQPPDKPLQACDLQSNPDVCNWQLKSPATSP